MSATIRQLDLILPCYNPLDGWQKIVVASVTRLSKELIARDLVSSQIRVIVVNDGSTRPTWHVGVEELTIHLPDAVVLSSAQNSGKGHALRQGFAVSTGDVCIFTDVDFPYTDESFVAIVEALRSDRQPDIVIGERASTYYEKVPLARPMLSKSFRLFLRVAYGHSLRDTQCGIKGFGPRGRELLLKTETNRYLVDLELLLLGSVRKFKIEGRRVELRSGIEFSKMGLKAIAREFVSLVPILIRASRAKRA